MSNNSLERLTYPPMSGDKPKVEELKVFRPTLVTACTQSWEVLKMLSLHPLTHGGTTTLLYHSGTIYNLSGCPMNYKTMLKTLKEPSRNRAWYAISRLGLELA